MLINLSQAFLQDVTYKQLIETTGEPQCDVCCHLPLSNIAALTQLPEYHDFTSTVEVLWCTTPGTESVDASWTFRLKHAKVTRDKCNFVLHQNTRGTIVLPQ